MKSFLGLVVLLAFLLTVAWAAPHDLEEHADRQGRFFGWGGGYGGYRGYGGYGGYRGWGGYGGYGGYYGYPYYGGWFG